MGMVGTVVAERECRRYVNRLMAEAASLGYPDAASFAKEMSKGTVSLAPCPDDAIMDCVGDFLIHVAMPIQRKVLIAAYDFQSYPTLRAKLHETGLRKDRFYDTLDAGLTFLAGYLIGVGSR